MRQFSNTKFVMLFVALGIPLILTHPALATDGNVMQVESFIKVVSGLAGLVATGFFVAGILRARVILSTWKNPSIPYSTPA